MKVMVFGDTKQGADHTENEDSMLIDTTRNLYAIADGVTIPEGGKEASSRAVTYLENVFNYDLKKAVEEVNKKILEDKDVLRVGYTTIVATALKNNILEVANVGDTPAFLVRDNKIVMLTVPDKFLTGSLTQALGEQNVKVHVTKEKLKQNDYVILASDGITNILTEEEILEIVKKYKDPKKIVESTFVAVEEEPQTYNDDKTMIVPKVSE